MGWGRAYFAVQAVAGAAWWLAVALSPWVRETTLGDLDPVVVAALDVPLFVIGSALAAAGIRAAAWVATVWTLFVAIALAVYATITTEAGAGVLIMAVSAGGSVLALCLTVSGRVPTAWIVSGPFAFRPALPRSTSAPHLASTLGQIVLFWGFFLWVVPVVLVFFEERWGVGVAMPPIVPLVGAVLLAAASALGMWSGFTMSVVGRGTPLPAAIVYGISPIDVIPELLTGPLGLADDAAVWVGAGVAVWKLLGGREPRAGGATPPPAR